MLHKALNRLDQLVFGETNQIKKFEFNGPYNHRFSDIGVDNYGGEICFFFSYATVNDREIVFHDVFLNGQSREEKVIPKRFVEMDELRETGAVEQSCEVEA